MAKRSSTWTGRGAPGQSERASPDRGQPILGPRPARLELSGPRTPWIRPNCGFAAPMTRPTVRTVRTHWTTGVPAMQPAGALPLPAGQVRKSGAPLCATTRRPPRGAGASRQRIPGRDPRPLGPPPGMVPATALAVVRPVRAMSPRGVQGAAHRYARWLHGLGFIPIDGVERPERCAPAHAPARNGLARVARRALPWSHGRRAPSGGRSRRCRWAGRSGGPPPAGRRFPPRIAYIQMDRVSRVGGTAHVPLANRFSPGSTATDRPTGHPAGRRSHPWNPRPALAIGAASGNSGHRSPRTAFSHEAEAARRLTVGTSELKEICKTSAGAVLHLIKSAACRLRPRAGRRSAALALELSP